ncbi:hypothetical protein [Patulibacter americanus]|uniref:hypothetical protein n=1 Tax=Patulibacter americanus TaxID=588672 RepID=UPI0003B55B89|nr:hypothetical protein [Patulibacter americanus]
MSAGGPPRRVPAPGWDSDDDVSSTSALEAWAEARVDELVTEGYAALRDRGHGLVRHDVGGLDAEVEVRANLYAPDCIDVTATVWRPRPARTFPGSLLPRLHRSLACGSVSVAPDGTLVWVEVDGELVPLEDSLW